MAGLRPLAYTACSFVGALTWTAAWQIGLWAGGTAFVQLWHRYQLYALLLLVIIAVPVVLLLRTRRNRAEIAQLRGLAWPTGGQVGRQGTDDLPCKTEVAK